MALYVQRRLGRRRLASYEFDANLRWLLTANELADDETRVELGACLALLDDDPAQARRRLELLYDRLGLEAGTTGSTPQPTDVVELFTGRPEFPGIRRLVDGAQSSTCTTDPTILSAAFTSIEWALSQAGGDELILSAAPPVDHWQQFELRGEGGVDAYNLAEVNGPLRAVETALASTGLPVTGDRSRMRWLIDFPLAGGTAAAKR